MPPFLILRGNKCPVLLLWFATHTCLFILILSVGMATITKLPVYNDNHFDSWYARKRARVPQHILEAHGFFKLATPLTMDSSEDDKQLIHLVTFNNSLLIPRATCGHRLPSSLRASSQRELL